MTDNITADAALAEINKTHAIVLHNCRCMVFIQSEDSNHLELVRPNALLRRYANDHKMLHAFKAWMKNPNRREYPLGIYLKPMAPVVLSIFGAGAGKVRLNGHLLKNTGFCMDMGNKQPLRRKHNGHWLTVAYYDASDIRALIALQQAWLSCSKSERTIWARQAKKESARCKK